MDSHRRMRRQAAAGGACSSGVQREVRWRLCRALPHSPSLESAGPQAGAAQRPKRPSPRASACPAHQLKRVDGRLRARPRQRPRRHALRRRDFVGVRSHHLKHRQRQRGWKRGWKEGGRVRPTHAQLRARRRRWCSGKPPKPAQRRPRCLLALQSRVCCQRWAVCGVTEAASSMGSRGIGLCWAPLPSNAGRPRASQTRVLGSIRNSIHAACIGDRTGVACRPRAPHVLERVI